MSLSEQRSQADIEIQRDELRARAPNVCRSLREAFLDLELPFESFEAATPP